MAKLELNIKKNAVKHVYKANCTKALELDKSLPPLHKPPRANKQVSKFFHLGVARLLWAWERLACKIFLATSSDTFGFHFALLFCSSPRKQTGPRRPSRCLKALYAIWLYTPLQNLNGTIKLRSGYGSNKAVPWKVGYNASGQLLLPLLGVISSICAEFEFKADTFSHLLLQRDLNWSPGTVFGFHVPYTSPELQPTQRFCHSFRSPRGAGSGRPDRPHQFTLCHFF